MFCHPKFQLILIIAALLSCAARPSLALTFDASDDFSSSHNPNGIWSYGWSSSLGSSLNLYTDPVVNGELNGWIYPPITSLNSPFVWHNGTENLITSGTVKIEANQIVFHPGPSGQYSIVRWTAPEAGNYSLATTFAGADYIGQTTTDVHVLHNSTSIFNDLINGFGESSAKSFTSTLQLMAGDTIDFAVGFGSNGHFYYDSTRLAATLSTATSPDPIPEPSSTLGLLALGVLGWQLRPRR